MQHFIAHTRISDILCHASHFLRPLIISPTPTLSLWATQWEGLSRHPCCLQVIFRRLLQCSLLSPWHQSTFNNRSHEAHCGAPSGSASACPRGPDEWSSLYPFFRPSSPSFDNQTYTQVMGFNANNMEVWTSNLASSLGFDGYSFGDVLFPSRLSEFALSGRKPAPASLPSSSTIVSPPHLTAAPLDLPQQQRIHWLNSRDDHVGLIFVEIKEYLLKSNVPCVGDRTMPQ